MEGVRVASMKVRTEEERIKFSQTWPTFATASATHTTASARWDKMAIDWNADVDAIVKAGNDAIKPIFRKTASHLEQYWKQ